MGPELTKNRGWIDCFFERLWLGFTTTYCTLDSCRANLQNCMGIPRTPKCYSCRWLQFDVSHASSKTNTSSKRKKDTGHRFLKAPTLLTYSFPVLLSAALNMMHFFVLFWGSSFFSNPTMNSYTAEEFSGTYPSTNILFLSSTEPVV